MDGKRYLSSEVPLGLRDDLPCAKVVKKGPSKNVWRILIEPFVSGMSGNPSESAHLPKAVAQRLRDDDGGTKTRNLKIPSPI
jgi:hypothetical protein